MSKKQNGAGRTTTDAGEDNPLDRRRPAYQRWDFDRPPEPPEWNWAGVFTQGSFVLWSGRFSSAKTLMLDGLTAAMLRGEPFLGRETAPGPVLRIDAENHPHYDAYPRLRSMGVTNEHRDDLLYITREQAPEIGSKDWNRWLEAEISEHDPGLIVLDGSVSATSVPDANDAEAVKRLYGSLRAVLADHRATVVPIHHERKPDQQMGRGDAANASTGTRYWHNLADLGYAVQKRGDTEVTETDEGRRLTTVVRLDHTKPLRTTATPGATHVEITGDLGPDGELLRTQFQLTDDPKAADLRETIIRAGRPLAHGELIKASGMKDSGAFDEARRAALAHGAITQPDGSRTPYHAGDSTTTTTDGPAI